MTIVSKVQHCVPNQTIRTTWMDDIVECSLFPSIRWTSFSLPLCIILSRRYHLGYLICVPIQPEWTQQSDFEAIEGWSFQVRYCCTMHRGLFIIVCSSSRQSKSDPTPKLKYLYDTARHMPSDSVYFKNKEMLGIHFHVIDISSFNKPLCRSWRTYRRPRYFYCRPVSPTPPTTSCHWSSDGYFRGIDR